MIKFFAGLLIAVYSLSISLKAQGAFLIEPYAGLNFNGRWQDHGESSTNSFSGSMYGGRVGIQNFGLMLGLDGRQGNWSIDNDAGDELDYTHYAAFVGYDFPFLLRIYMEYILTGTGIDQDGNSLIGASGFVAGIGYKFFPYLSANVETGSVAYKELELDDGTNLEDREEQANYLLFSLSVPLTIGL